MRFIRCRTLNELEDCVFLLGRSHADDPSPSLIFYNLTQAILIDERGIEYKD